MTAMGLTGLASCGGSSDNTAKPQSTPSSKEDTKTIAYQFKGNYTDATLTGLGYDYYILLNLFSDGTVAGSGYNKLSMDSSSYEKNTGFSEKWWKGTWKDAKNDEDLAYIDLKVSYGSDAKNIMGGTTLEGSFEYELYKDAAGKMTFTIDCPIFSGRKQEISGSSTVEYADFNSFIQGNLYTWTAPTGSIAVFDTTSESSTIARIYCMPKGSAYYYTGKTDPATNEVKYIAAGEWTWSYATDLVFSNGTTSYTATVTDNAATLTYTTNLMGNEFKYVYSCSDVSALKTDGGKSEEKEEEVTVLATFADTSNNTVVFNSDKSAKLSAYSGMLNISFTWKYENEKLVLTDASDASKTYDVTVNADKSATFTYAATLAGNPISLTFTCADVTALLA